MRKIGLLVVGLAIVIFVNGQTIKIQGGTSISKLNWKIFNNALYDDALIGYSFFMGIDYFDKQYFNLSSNIGMLRKGGVYNTSLLSFDENAELISIGTYTEKATLDYVSLNTTIDFKYPIKEKFSPFVGVGPRFDYLVASNKIFEGFKEVNTLKNYSIGLILGAGLKYDISNFQIGLRADYYVNFTEIAHFTQIMSNFTPSSEKITANTYTINLIFGYKLK